MIGQSLVAREAEVLKTLRAIHQMREKSTLIGGYAVNAYSTLPRYSVDCDIVVANPQVEKLLSFFKDRDYTEKGKAYLNEIEGIATRKLVKKVGGEQVSVDLLVERGEMPSDRCNMERGRGLEYITRATRDKRQWISALERRLKGTPDCDEVAFWEGHRLKRCRNADE